MYSSSSCFTGKEVNRQRFLYCSCVSLSVLMQCNKENIDWKKIVGRPRKNMQLETTSRDQMASISSEKADAELNCSFPFYLNHVIGRFDRHFFQFNSSFSALGSMTIETMPNEFILTPNWRDGKQLKTMKLTWPTSSAHLTFLIWKKKNRAHEFFKKINCLVNNEMLSPRHKYDRLHVISAR